MVIETKTTGRLAQRPNPGTIADLERIQPVVKVGQQPAFLGPK